MEEVNQRVLRARIRLALSQPFLASAVMRLPIRAVHGAMWCRTAATDGYHIFYNPNWITTLSDAEMRGLLAHEILHVLFAHGDRRQEREAQTWNLACDYAINQLLLQQGFELPSGGLWSDSFQHMTAEAIYAKLEGADEAMRSVLHDKGKTKPQQNDQGNSAVPMIGADLLPAEDASVRPHRTQDAPDPEQLDALRRELRDSAMQAMQGTAQGSFRGECRAHEKGRVDWRSLLRSWLYERIKGDWSSYPFSKRYLHRGLYMPSAHMMAPGHVVFAIDTSGSMADDMLSRIFAELRMFRETFPCRLTVLQADAAIQERREYDAMDGADIPKVNSVVGRGGTDFRPVFEWVEREAPQALVLYATDGYGSFPDRSPSTPTIWLLTSNHVDSKRVPFGTLVEIA